MIDRIKRGLFYTIPLLPLILVALVSLIATMYDSAMKSQMDKVERPLTHTEEEFECLARTIFYEAGNQSMEGKEAVALVVMNRVESEDYSRNICEVVKQKARLKNKTICQFSYFCEKLPPPWGKRWDESLIAARNGMNGIYSKDVVMLVQDSVYYHADYVKPHWAKVKVFMGKIGDHLFYEENLDK